MITTNSYNAVVTGGGTGGHFYPAYILYEKLKKSSDINKIYYIGSDYGIEKRLAAELKLNYTLTKARGFIGKSLYDKIIGLLLNFYSFIFCLFFLLKNNIKIVVAAGGYVSLPVLAAAVILRKKFFIQEQNSFPGITTRIFSRFAEKIFIAFEDAKKYFSCASEKIITVNTPARDEFYSIIPNEKKNSIAIVGGSQGSFILNEIVFDSLDFFRENKITVLWVTGRQFYEKYKDYSDEYIKILEYCNDIYKLLADVELIVSRAGATSIAEYKILAKKVLFIPFAAATHNHQFYNAVSYCNSYTAEYILEKELKKELFIEKIKILLTAEKKNIYKTHENAADIIIKNILSSF